MKLSIFQIYDLFRNGKVATDNGFITLDISDAERRLLADKLGIKAV